MSQILDISIRGAFLFSGIYFSIIFAAYWHDAFTRYLSPQRTIARPSPETIIPKLEEPEIVREIRKYIHSPSLHKTVQKYLGKEVSEATQAELIAVWTKIEDRWGDEFFAQVQQDMDRYHND
ncbi:MULTISPECIES: hypothetical protein [Cyanophyceae]|uniref:hypothetical protein n=1 Tax=Cyanophyceae TaxID=3028117 RepID=UPI00059DD567|nr:MULTISPECIES: hypothetical protein [Cyanophyceae]SMH48582.1 hypothetical protein SAMN06272755_1970 [Picosynechococcus sp. OG1]SMH58941.1 hypothetical protein SAMN06272755_3278 [Picosynechococcus sp. OG1]SMH59089.1 hypothetical protein SAMN06272755_3312 [Picosynechococcus sp. OG1]SMQ81349.1 hypothetical protein SAMN06272774_1247 [Synechococcus sp. 7002]SMQ86515.1 hypothetical protein SAMN06272774_3272 [Synechococcus sp. 7002]